MSLDQVSKLTLQKAAEEKIITMDQVDPLYHFFQKQALGVRITVPAKEGESSQKFVRSFGDVFIALGIVLLMMAVNITDFPEYYYLLPAVGFVALAEWLVRVRRLALPGVAILIAILFLVSKSISFGDENAIVIGLGALSLTSLLFYLRYKMPFSLLPLAMSLVAIPITQVGFEVFETPAIFVGLGMVVFVIAFWFDSQDTERQTLLSDNAFWLYLLASPLVVHGIMLLLFTSDVIQDTSVGVEILMIAFFAVFFLLSLLIDRRVILVSTQLYMIYALFQLLQDRLSNMQDAMIYILIGLGLFVIYFGSYWYKSRRFVFTFLKGGIISRYVPDFDIEDVKR